MHEDEAFKKQFDWHITRRILQYVRPYRFTAFVALAFSLVIALAGQAFPRLVGLAIDNFLNPKPNATISISSEARWNGIVSLCLVIIAISVLEFLARYGFQLLLARMGQYVLYDIRGDIFAKLQRLPLAYFDKNPVGRLITRVTSDVDAINQFITNGLVTLAQSVFVLAAVLGFMFALDWRLTLVSASVVPLLFFATQYFGGKMRDNYRKIRVRQAIVNTSLNENITGMATTQLFNRENRNRRDFDSLNQNFLGAQLESVTWFSLYFPTVNFLGTFALALVVWYGGGRVIQGAITVGTLYAFTRYVFNFFAPLEDLSDVMNTLQAAMASAERIFGVLDEPETVSDKEGAKTVQSFRGEVEFKDVWFAYTPAGETPTEQDWVLRGINFKVMPGESVAFVGATGAGKTSVISLLSRFYDVQRGSVLLDDTDVRDYAQRSLRKHVGVVLQDVFLFAGTILSNLRMGDTSIGQNRIEQACKYVGVHEFIAGLPNGYNTEVKERGATLSTGQKQLLAFARALIQNPDILLVLDEATASVDTESEMQIQDALAKLMHGRTSLIIAHRLSTIKHCDRIIVMRKGKIVEEGNHDTLLSNAGYYAKLYNLQYADQESINQKI